MNIEFVLKVIFGVFALIVITKILMDLAAYVGEQFGVKRFVEFLFRKIRKK